MWPGPQAQPAVAVVLQAPAAGYQEGVTLDQWLAAEFQEAVVGPLLAGPQGLLVGAVVAVAALWREQRRSP